MDVYGSATLVCTLQVVSLLHFSSLASSPSSRRLSKFVMVSSPASLTLVSSSFVNSTSSGIIILCVLSSLLKRNTNQIKTTFSIKH